jgi:hypothetical protein
MLRREHVVTAVVYSCEGLGMEDWSDGWWKVYE